MASGAFATDACAEVNELDLLCGGRQRYADHHDADGDPVGVDAAQHVATRRT